ncbi:MAG: TRAP transporter large permease subunit [Propionibacteriales bacterium]|nr:TRAP transporter large permease subunit [Propionibacteriales bacterium]
MSSMTIAAVIGGVLLTLLALGVPVAFALGLTALIATVLFLDAAQFGFFANLTFESLNSFSLLAIPLFILMGAVFGQSKASTDLLEAANAWMGRLRGGLAMSSVLACSVFAALTGSSPATSAAIGRIAIPEMLRRGYPNGVATGAIVAGGTLGILIPPSVTLILYGIATEQSIGRLFLGGVGPGILVTVLFCAWIAVAMSLHRSGRGAGSAAAAEGTGEPSVGGTAGGRTSLATATLDSQLVAWRTRIAMLVKVIPFVLLMAGVLVALYAGIATPSEAAAVGAALAVVLVAVLYRSITVRKLLDVALETTRTSTMILMIVAFSAVLGQIMSFLGIPQDLAQAVAEMDVNRWIVFFAMNVLFLVLGFFIPPVAIILVTMPVLFPIVTQFGFDPIWFGVVMTLNMEMGLITPPVGLNLYVVQGVAPEVPLRDVLIGSLPYVGVLAVGIVLLILFPDVVTWLPDQM